MIPLLDKTDNFEKIRDAVAAILAAETAHQQALATAAHEDPEPYRFRVFIERTNPFEVFLNGSTDLAPIVNVYFETVDFDKAKSNLSDRQQGTSVINVDCIAHGRSEASGGGHTVGDETAGKAAAALARLVRNILMHDDHKYLGLQGTVARRWIRGINSFLIATAEPAATKIRGARIALEVDHIETAMIADETTIEAINVTFLHTPEGEIIAEAEYNFGD